MKNKVKYTIFISLFILVSCSFSMSKKVSAQSPVIKSIIKNSPITLKQALTQYNPAFDGNKIGQDAILLAINNENLELLNILFEAGITFNYQISNSNNPLDLAINNGVKDIVILMIKYLTDQNNLRIPDPENIYNTFNSNKPLLKNKLYQYINDYPKTSKPSGSLNQAIIDNNKPLLNKLIEDGVNLNQRDTKGKTPLINAIYKGDEETVLELIKAGADYSLPDLDYHTPLMHAAEKGDLKIVILLINLGEDPSIKGMDEKSALSMARENGNQNIVDYIDRNNMLEANPKEINQVISNFSDDNKTSVNKPTPSPKQMTMTKPLPQNQEVIDKTTNYPEYKQIQENLKNGLDPNQFTKAGLSPLMESIKSNDPQIIYLLIKYGAKVDLTDTEGNTALMLAAIHDSDIAIKSLYKKGASLESKNIYGITALMLASMNNKQNAVKMLLKLGAKVNTRNIKGQTALMFAAYYNHDKVIAELLTANADKTIVDVYGRNALSLAYYRKNTKAIEQLSK